MIYGVYLPNSTPIHEDKAIAFLHELHNNGHTDFLENYHDNLEMNDNDYPFKNWIENYQNDNGNHGLAAFLADVIALQENVHLYVPDDDEHLGMELNTPWSFNDTEKDLSSEKYKALLQTYLSKVIENPPSIGWYS